MIRTNYLHDLALVNLLACTTHKNNTNSYANYGQRDAYALTGYFKGD